MAQATSDPNGLMLELVLANGGLQDENDRLVETAGQMMQEISILEAVVDQLSRQNEELESALAGRSFRAAPKVRPVRLEMQRN